MTLLLRSLALVSLPLLTACAHQDEAFPLADAGPSLLGEVRQPITLAAGVSSATSWFWAIVEVPVRSELGPGDLLDADTPWPTLLPDVEGEYVMELQACDEIGWCGWDQVTVAVAGRAAVEEAASHRFPDDPDPLDFRPNLIRKGGTWSSKWGSGARPPWVRPAVKPTP